MFLIACCLKQDQLFANWVHGTSRTAAHNKTDTFVIYMHGMTDLLRARKNFCGRIGHNYKCSSYSRSSLEKSRLKYINVKLVYQKRQYDSKGHMSINMISCLSHPSARVTGI